MGYRCFYDIPKIKINKIQKIPIFKNSLLNYFLNQSWDFTGFRPLPFGKGLRTLKEEDDWKASGKIPQCGI
jgi:hypothetical protein